MSKIKKICYLAMLTALYVVLSAFLKITLIGNIQVDLGYIAFAVALSMFGVSGAIVGVVGCCLESILFSAYGFSISWAIANLIIGVGCGIVFHKSTSYRIWCLAIVLFCALGLIGAKTIIECILYSIPVVVKIQKNIVACGVDILAMFLGVDLAIILSIKNKGDG